MQKLQENTCYGALKFEGCIITEKRIHARCFSAKFDRFLTDYLLKASFASTIRNDIKDTTVRTTTTLLAFPQPTRLNHILRRIDIF